MLEQRPDGGRTSGGGVFQAAGTARAKGLGQSAHGGGKGTGTCHLKLRLGSSLNFVQLQVQEGCRSRRQNTRKLCFSSFGSAEGKGYQRSPVF